MDYRELLDYGCLKFENNEYEEALETFIWLYQNGYEQEWILNNIYSCYVDGNENEFRQSYSKSGNSDICAYEDCTLDFVPYRDGEYFVFNKTEKIFMGVFSINDFNTEHKPAIFERDEFSDVVIENDWDYRNFSNVIAGATDRKIYMIANDIRKAASFYKIPEFTANFNNIILFPGEKQYRDYFHKNTMVYLPKIIFTENKTYEDGVKKIFDEEHAYRLTDEGRNSENVILTIGIPTHNRGNLLLKRLEHLLPMKYDAEIEIVVAKNGNALYQDEYRQASEIKDSRYVYCGVDDELRPEVNWHNVVTHANGKYVLFISDEDEVVLESLDHYLKLLKTGINVAQIRAKTSSQYKKLKKQYGVQGTDAFKLVFLGQNYLSGLIVNRRKFLDADLLKLEKHWDNAFYRTYPHEWWCACLSKAGDSITEPILLIEEKEAVLQQENQLYEQMGLVKKNEYMDQNSGLPSYATFDGRFDQFDGQVEFLELYMSDDPEAVYIGLKMAIDKLSILLHITSTYGCEKEKYAQIIHDFIEKAQDSISKFNFNKDQINELLMRIKVNERYLVLKGERLK